MVIQTRIEIPEPVLTATAAPIPEPLGIDSLGLAWRTSGCLGFVAKSFSWIRVWGIAAPASAPLTTFCALRTVVDRAVLVGYNPDMNVTPDALSFFSVRARTYARFIRLFRYQQGLQKYLVRLF